MTALAKATQRRPFANGSEGSAWMSVWCEFCTKDHAAHDETYEPEGCCDLIGDTMLTLPDWRWPEAWIPEPPGSFSLPPRMICTAFEPCTEGSCTGDHHAETRVAIRSEVIAEWKQVES